MISFKFVSKTGDPFSEILKEVKDFDKNLKIKTDLLGDETAAQMKQIISDNKVRPQTNQPTVLENAIEVEHSENGWGVGDIEKLKSVAPGWAAINFGSSHMIGKHLPLGTFDPGEPAPNQGFFRAGRWQKGKDYNGEKYSPIVKNPIPAMNYIEKTVFWLSNKFDTLRGK